MYITSSTKSTKKKNETELDNPMQYVSKRLVYSEIVLLRQSYFLNNDNKQKLFVSYSNSNCTCRHLLRGV